MAAPTRAWAKGAGSIMGRGSARRMAVGYAFILPALLLYAIFFIYPFVVSIYYSMISWKGVGPKQFVGLDNYQRLLSDNLLLQVLSHNLVWVIIGTAAPIVIALLLGGLMWRGLRGMTFFRVVYFLPVVLADVVVAITWNWIYHPLFGALNQILTAIGLGSLTRGWLGDPNTALLAVIATAIWQYFGFCFVVIMAGLQNVNLELVEAAMIDGANPWQRFRFVLIPELRHVLTMITAFTLIGGFNVFGIVFVMTQGGPGTATQVIATYMYREFAANNIGYSATLSLVITVISLVTSYLFIRFRERSE